MIVKTQIPLADLIPGRWYLGRGRNANVAFWTGRVFVTIGLKRGIGWDVKLESFFTENDGCFQPFLLLDEGRVDPLGRNGWNKHYGRSLIFDRKTRRKRRLPIQQRKKHELDIEELKSLPAEPAPPPGWKVVRDGETKPS